MPLLDPAAIHGALFVKKSAIVAGADTTAALARDAAAGGAVRFLPHVEVTDVEVQSGRVAAGEVAV